MTELHQATEYVGVPRSMQRRENKSVGQLPSSDAVKTVLEGGKGGWWKVLVSTTLRGLLMTPGLYIVGIRGWQLVGAAMIGSATITTFLFIFYGAKLDKLQGPA